MRPDIRNLSLVGLNTHYYSYYYYYYYYWRRDERWKMRSAQIPRINLQLKNRRNRLTCQSIDWPGWFVRVHAIFHNPESPIPINR